MALFSRLKVWSAREILTSSAINAEFNNTNNNATDPAYIEDISTNVAAMQATADPGAVGTESLPANLSGELQRIRYALKRIVGGAQWYTAPVIDLNSLITTAKIADGAVTTLKIADGNVTIAKILDGNITTAKIANANVTKEKLVAVGQQFSGSSGGFSTASTTFVNVTNLNLTLTTTGRPVFVAMTPFAIDSETGVQMAGQVGATRGDIRIVRNLAGTPAVIAFNRFGAGAVSTSTIFVNVPGAVFTLDLAPAGTHTYHVQARSVAGGTDVLTVTQQQLVAFEL